MRGPQDVDPVDLLDIGLADPEGDRLAQDQGDLFPFLAVDLFGIFEPPRDLPRMSTGRQTAQARTGPANGPRPTSSTPQTMTPFLIPASISCFQCGMLYFFGSAS